MRLVDRDAVECPDADDAVRVVAQRLLPPAREPATLSTGTYSISASIGVGLSRPDDTVAELVRRADEAMYEAKRAGQGPAAQPGAGVHPP